MKIRYSLPEENLIIDLSIADLLALLAGKTLKDIGVTVLGIDWNPINWKAIGTRIAEPFINAFRSW